MKYIKTDWAIPYYNMALEDYLMTNQNFQDDYLFFYVHEPSIIVGKHQNTYAEINQKFVNDRNIHVARRISGGGAVYHDVGNLNFSYIFQRKEGDTIDFKKYTMPVIDALKKLGIDSEMSGRNDILIDGKKFSGNAQFMNKEKLLHHGTLMFDVDIEDLIQALNVSQMKIESKAIESVRSRVANLKDYCDKDLTLAAFQQHLIECFFETDDFEEYHLTEQDKSEVQHRVDETFSTWEHNYGKSPDFVLSKKKKYTAGIVEAHLDVTQNIITSIHFYGDFFSLCDIAALQQVLTGIRYEEGSVRDALSQLDISTVIVNMTNEELIDLLFL